MDHHHHHRVHVVMRDAIAPCIIHALPVCKIDLVLFLRRGLYTVLYY